MRGIFLNPSEHVRHAYVSAKATVFSSVAVDVDICLPWVGLGSFHPQTQFAPDAASLHAGGTDGRVVYRTFRFAVEFVLISNPPYQFHSLLDVPYLAPIRSTLLFTLSRL